MNISRRDVLAGAAALALTPKFALAAPAKKTIRVAHMTDFHIQPELGAEKGVEMAMHSVHTHNPELILCGGDLIMDGVAQTEERTKLQWGLFDRHVVKATKKPMHFALGNHDVWGWNKEGSHTTGNEAKWGKQWFQDQFGYHASYHSFDQGGWHFVVLDNIFHTPDGYNGLVDEAQMEWLKADLRAHQKPTLVMTHIPLLSVTAVVQSWDKDKGEWQVGGNLMTKNLNDLLAVFAQNPHVKIALSGHTHLLDRVDFQGVSFLCNGAVCGAWWKGPNNGVDAGYAILDLHHDGTFDARYHTWGWTKELMG